MHNTAGCNSSLNLTKDDWESWGKEGGEKVCLWKTVRYLRQAGTAGLTLYVSPGGIVCVDWFILAGWHAHWETEMSSSREREKKINRCREKQKERWINKKEKRSDIIIMQRKTLQNFTGARQHTWELQSATSVQVPRSTGHWVGVKHLIFDQSYLAPAYKLIKTTVEV